MPAGPGRKIDLAWSEETTIENTSKAGMQALSGRDQWKS